MSCAGCGSSSLLRRGYRETKAGRVPRLQCRDCGAWTSLRTQAEGKTEPATREFEVPTWVPKHKRLVITWAQNATPVHEPTLDALETYCRLNDAQLVVIPGRYKNPTSVFQDYETDTHYDPRIVRYLTKATVPFGPNMNVYGGISIQPTAVRPLSGFEVFAGSASAVFGSPKIQLETVPTSERYYPRIFSTTGAVTVPNYTDSKAGQKASAHHVYGAIVLEQDGELFHQRHLRPDRDGALYDLDKFYARGECITHAGVSALILGDLHVAKLDDDGLAAARKLLELLCPDHLVLHDVFDMDTRNHHRRGDWLDKVRRRSGRGLDHVEDEVSDTCDTLAELAGLARDTWVVRSNHDEALDRWLLECDHRQDPANARFAYSLLARMAAAAEKGESFDPLEFCYKHAKPDVPLHFLRRNQSLRVLGIECGFHGDKGTNGSRGSINAYARLGAKTVTGHSHSPGTRDGAMAVGVTARLAQGYNHLPSSWLNSHVVIYPNGKRTHIHIIEGRFRAC